MRLRAALAYAYRCSPVDLRDATGAEIAAMIEVLQDVTEGGGDGRASDPQD